MIALLALALAQADAAPPEEPPVAPREGGICVGLAWVPLLPGEQAWKEQGADFSVYRFNGKGGSEDRWWGVYAGGYPQVRGNGPVLARLGGVTIRRAREDGKFRGYVAEQGRGRYLVNHFFGSVFKGDPSDKALFARMDFGEKRDRLCGKPE